MTPLGGRARSFAMLLLAVALAGCGAGSCPVPATSAPSGTGESVSTPTASLSDTSTSGELTDAEILWLVRFNRTARALNDGLSSGPTNIASSDQMRREAESQRACGRALSGIADPGPRLHQIYATFTEACAHFDRAAECASTAAPYLDGVEAGSKAARALSEALDCYGASLAQGSLTFGKAYEEGVRVLCEIPSP
jgi:hypothetical protein